MPLDRIVALHERLVELARRHGEVGRPAPPPSAARLTNEDVRQVLESQLTARHLDRCALELRARGEGFYTITSAGHEGNAVLGRILRVTDPALLHYRSAGFFLERARQRPHFDAVDAVTLGLTASSEDPIAGGRHKVFGSVELCVLPQTSTIASQLPKAVGLAFSIERAHRGGATPRVGEVALPRDSIVMTSLGDASLNHASATVALNAALWVQHQGLPLPLLIVCEDNGLGLSVRTPAGFVERLLQERSGLAYYRARGWDLAELHERASAAVELCRDERRPVVLHLECVRLLGHSGADPDTTYRARDEIERALERDPVLATARTALSLGALDGAELLELDAQAAARVDRSAARAITRPKLQSAAEVVAPLVAAAPDRVAAEARRGAAPEQRALAFGGPERLPELQGPQPLSRLLNWALFDVMAKYPNAMVFGEDVAEKGGVYNVTAGLWRRFGAARVFNTLLDETTILGLAQGAAQVGLLPIPEIQYLAFLHNAEDQLRGEAASTAFFSRGQLRSPLVVRIASFGYQKGFGGHFHNDNSIAVLRDIPGILIAAPGDGADAVRMLRTCVAAADVEGRVVAFLEPIALYTQRDLHAPGDGLLACTYPAPDQVLLPGEVGVYDAEHADLSIVSYANGLWLSRRAARRLLQEHGVRARVVDLRWLSPLPFDAVCAHARDTGKVLVVDECRRPGNVGEAVVSEIALRHREVALGLVTAADSFVPLGDAARLVLPSEQDVVDAALRLCGS